MPEVTRGGEEEVGFSKKKSPIVPYKVQLYISLNPF